MTLHPISVVDQVLDEYRSHLLTEFRARDQDLRQALEEVIDQPGFLAQEPFFQAHRPFCNGDRWRDLPLDAKLAQVMEDRARKHGSPTPEHAYLHQSQAIAELLAAEPRPVAVTTGTGSGKTECYEAWGPEVLEPADLGSVEALRAELDRLPERLPERLREVFQRVRRQIVGLQETVERRQVEIAPVEGSAPITVADFAIPARRVAIYVDGAAFHRGERLRRDRWIRGRLAEAGWDVKEWTARDLARGEELVNRLRS